MKAPYNQDVGHFHYAKISLVLFLDILLDVFWHNIVVLIGISLVTSEFKYILCILLTFIRQCFLIYLFIFTTVEWLLWASPAAQR